MVIGVDQSAVGIGSGQAHLAQSCENIIGNIGFIFVKIGRGTDIDGFKSPAVPVCPGGSGKILSGVIEPSFKDVVMSVDCFFHGGWGAPFSFLILIFVLFVGFFVLL